MRISPDSTEKTVARLALPGLFNTYLLHFACYGAGAPRSMQIAPYRLDHRRREIVLEGLTEICQYRRWVLLAANVGADRVHVVISADIRPAVLTRKLKDYASGKLDAMSVDIGKPRRWARSGTAIELSTGKQIADGVASVTADRGDSASVWQARRFPQREVTSLTNYRETISPMYTASRQGR